MYDERMEIDESKFKMNITAEEAIMEYKNTNDDEDLVNIIMALRRTLLYVPINKSKLVEVNREYENVIPVIEEDMLPIITKTTDGCKWFTSFTRKHFIPPEFSKYEIKEFTFQDILLLCIGIKGIDGLDINVGHDTHINLENYLTNEIIELL